VGAVDNEIESESAAAVAAAYRAWADAKATELAALKARAVAEEPWVVELGAADQAVSDAIEVRDRAYARRVETTVVENDAVRAAMAETAAAFGNLTSVALSARKFTGGRVKSWRVGADLVKTAVRARAVISDLQAFAAYITVSWPVMLERILPRAVNDNVLQSWALIQQGQPVPGLAWEEKGSVSVTSAAAAGKANGDGERFE